MIFTNVRQVKTLEDARMMCDQMLRDGSSDLDKIESWGLALWQYKSYVYGDQDQPNRDMFDIAIGASLIVLAVREKKRENEVADPSST